MTLKYVLVTPAHNEAAYIERTLQSVCGQIEPPLKWVVVSDGSTDGTDAIVEKYAQSTDWLELVRLPPRRERNFAAKVHAFRAGYALVENLDFDVVGCLDADIAFGEDYFAYVLANMEARPDVGVAGTHYTEGSFHSFKDSFINAQHVNGQCQMFRRACFADIGGYQAIEGGGIDWVAVTTARMKGWKTESFEGRTFDHLRKMGTAGSNELMSRFRYGKKDYFLGGHPLWQLCRGGFQLRKKPYVVGGMALLLGYFWCWLRRAHRPVSAELMQFHRGEQLARLRGLLAGGMRVSRQSPSHRGQQAR